MMQLPFWQPAAIFNILTSIVLPASVQGGYCSISLNDYNSWYLPDAEFVKDLCKSALAVATQPSDATTASADAASLMVERNVTIFGVREYSRLERTTKQNSMDIPIRFELTDCSADGGSKPRIANCINMANFAGTVINAGSTDTIVFNGEAFEFNCCKDRQPYIIKNEQTFVREMCADAWLAEDAKRNDDGYKPPNVAELAYFNRTQTVSGTQLVLVYAINCFHWMPEVKSVRALGAGFDRRDVFATFRRADYKSLAILWINKQMYRFEFTDDAKAEIGKHSRNKFAERQCRDVLLKEDANADANSDNYQMPDKKQTSPFRATIAVGDDPKVSFVVTGTAYCFDLPNTRLADCGILKAENSALKLKADVSYSWATGDAIVELGSNKKKYVLNCYSDGGPKICKKRSSFMKKARRKFNDFIGKDVACRY